MEVEVEGGSRAAWERRQLLECVHHLLSTGADVTLVTADAELLGGDIVMPAMEGEWRVVDLQTFVTGPMLVLVYKPCQQSRALQTLQSPMSDLV